MFAHIPKIHYIAYHMLKEKSSNFYNMELRSNSSGPCSSCKK